MYDQKGKIAYQREGKAKEYTLREKQDQLEQAVKTIAISEEEGSTQEPPFTSALILRRGS